MTERVRRGRPTGAVILLVIGLVLLTGAGAALAYGLLALDPPRASIAAGELWFRVDRGSLNLVQAVTQRFLLPALWDPVAVSVLVLPAWIVLAVPGALLALIGVLRLRP